MPKTRKRHDGAAPSYENVGRSAEPEYYSHDRVATRAYELYLARGATDGQAVEDWLAAERELSTSPPGDSGQ